MTRCDWAACKQEAVTADQGWNMCRPHYYEHLRELREQAGRFCVRCGEGFVSTNPRTQRCKGCRKVDTRPPYLRRVS